MSFVNLKDGMIIVAVIAWTANASYAYNHPAETLTQNANIVIASN